VFQRDDEGFSLVEVLMAMFLLAMLALAVLPLIIGIT
jgi:prepilin-type N-terminal cleavage/methylation domain-containing protein